MTKMQSVEANPKAFTLAERTLHIETLKGMANQYKTSGNWNKAFECWRRADRLCQADLNG